MKLTGPIPVRGSKGKFLWADFEDEEGKFSLLLENVQNGWKQVIDPTYDGTPLIPSLPSTERLNKAWSLLDEKIDQKA